MSFSWLIDFGVLLFVFLTPALYSTVGLTFLPACMYFLTGDSIKLSSDTDDTDEISDLGDVDGVSSHFVTENVSCFISQQTFYVKMCYTNVSKF